MTKGLGADHQQYAIESMRIDIEKILKLFVSLSDGDLAETEIEVDLFHEACEKLTGDKFIDTINAMKVAGLLFIDYLFDVESGHGSYYKLTKKGIAEVEKIFGFSKQEEKQISKDALKGSVSKAMNFLRGFVDGNEFHFVLFLLTLQRNGVLKEIIDDNQSNLKQQIELAILGLNADAAEDLRIILNLYDHTLRKVNTKVVHELISFFRSLDQEVLEENFAEIFDELLYQFSKWQGREGGESVLPIEISRFVCSLAELPEQANVYNPFAGVASFGVCLGGRQQYVGQEINHAIWAIGKMRLMAYGKENNVKLLLGDSVQEWNPIQSYKLDKPEDVFKYPSSKGKYDLIIGNPPFGLRTQFQVSGKFGPIRSYEHFLIENGLDDLKADGKLIAIISQGFLFHAGTERKLRQVLVENDLLEMVISLPGGLLANTGIPVSVILINKSKKNKGYVHFVDAQKFVTSTSPREKILNDQALVSFIRTSKQTEFSTIVSNEAIQSLDFNLSVQRYFQKTYDGVPLNELCSSIKGLRIKEEKKGKLIRTRDLKDDALDFVLDTANIEDSELPRQAQKIVQSCLLLASRWKSLKPTYFNFTGTPIYVYPDIISFSVDESRCDVAFLIGELHSAYVLEQVEQLSVGSVQPSIRREDMLSVIISLPALDKQASLKEQKAITRKRLEDLANEKKRELILFNKIHGLESELIEQNTYLRHTLTGPISNLKGSIVNIRTILQDQVFNIIPSLADLKVSEIHDLTLSQYLSTIEKNINKIHEAVSQQLNVLPNIESKPLVPIEIVSFVKNFVSEQSHIDFSVDFDYDSYELINEEGKFREVYINGNADLLTDVFNNLVDNARRHAFYRYEGMRNIRFVLLLDYGIDSKNEVMILVSNTGFPFPIRLTQEDFIRKGHKSELSAGTGYGGWLINRVVTTLNGTFLIVHEDGDNRKPADYFVTHFEFSFPIIEMN